MTPYEARYGRRCTFPIGWFDAGELIRPDLVHQNMDKVKVIQDRLKMVRSCQKSYANVRTTTMGFKVND